MVTTRTPKTDEEREDKFCAKNRITGGKPVKSPQGVWYTRYYIDGRHVSQHEFELHEAHEEKPYQMSRPDTPVRMSADDVQGLFEAAFHHPREQTGHFIFADNLEELGSPLGAIIREAVKGNRPHSDHGHFWSNHWLGDYDRNQLEWSMHGGGQVRLDSPEGLHIRARLPEPENWGHEPGVILHVFARPFTHDRPDNRGYKLFLHPHEAREVAAQMGQNGEQLSNFVEHHFPQQPEQMSKREQFKQKMRAIKFGIPEPKTRHHYNDLGGDEFLTLANTAPGGVTGDYLEEKGFPLLAEVYRRQNKDEGVGLLSDGSGAFHSFGAYNLTAIPYKNGVIVGSTSLRPPEVMRKNPMPVNYANVRTLMPASHFLKLVDTLHPDVAAYFHKWLDQYYPEESA